MKRLARALAASMIVALAALGAQLGVAGTAAAQSESISAGGGDNIWM